MTHSLNPKEKSSSNTALRISFTKLRVLSRTYQQILYDSTTSSLSLLYISASSTAQSAGRKTNVSSSQDLSQSQSDKLSDAEKTRLRQSITNSGFFQANGIYPPNPTGAQDCTLGVLGITMDSKSHTVIWADTSSNVPTGLDSVVKILEDIASK